MSGRFLAVLDLQAHAPGRDVEQLAARLDLDIAWAKPGLAILADAALGRVGLGDHGLVLGRLLHRHGPARPIDRLDENDIGRIVEETGTLSRLHWGSYVALIESGGRFRVERDPSGAMPCYMARRAGMWAFSSRADLLCRAGFARPLICWRSLGRQLYRAGLPTSRTALADIEELLPGFAIESPDFVPMSRWSPWDDAAPADMPDMDALAETLARQVRLGVRGLCDGMGRILVSLSGGLDSALVAACLAEAGHDLVCLNLHTDDPHGDERA
jgi:asparagine synthase (glutamine-hydrolysing)